MEPAGDSTFPNWPEFRRLFAYDDLVGKVVQNRYEVVRRLGAGGMGVVFLARHIHLDKLFALKIISPRFLDDPQIGQRFLLEARAASKIDHPNVVNITDFGPPEEGPAFFAMEYLEGETLESALERVGHAVGGRLGIAGHDRDDPDEAGVLPQEERVEVGRCPHHGVLTGARHPRHGRHSIG